MLELSLQGKADLAQKEGKKQTRYKEYNETQVQPIRVGQVIKDAGHMTGNKSEIL